MLDFLLPLWKAIRRDRKKPSAMNRGYEDDRFANAVEEDFRCPICTKVLREPLQCRRNEHHFCSPCIRRHLDSNKTCPLCKEELTIETLQRPGKVVADHLSGLKMSCDNVERGCRELVELGVLESHVIDCKYSPATCSNRGCSRVVNKEDLEDHETKVCGLRNVKCDDCGEEMASVKFTTHGCALKAEISEMRKNWSGTKDRLERSLGLQEETMGELKDISTEVKMMGELREDMKRVATDVKAVKQSVQDLCATTRQIHLRKDIVVVGGLASDKPLPFVESFNWFDGKWTSMRQMKESRAGADAVMYDNKLLVSGGGTAAGVTDTVEVLDTSAKPERWRDFPAKLPLKCHGHKCVVHGNRLLVTGGLTDEHRASGGIYEVLLVPPYSSKLLCRMTQRRCYHGVALFDDKILIAGGMSSADCKDVLDDVIVYDARKNECKEMAPLPFPMCGMATVGWHDNVILMGGIDDAGDGSNAVVAYEIKTGKSKVLPSMRHKRTGCVAVVSRNSIVVMGGSEVEGDALDSAERFSLLAHAWEELPSMIEPRAFATGV